MCSGIACLCLQHVPQLNRCALHNSAHNIQVGAPNPLADRYLAPQIASQQAVMSQRGARPQLVAWRIRKEVNGPSFRTGVLLHVTQGGTMVILSPRELLWGAGWFAGLGAAAVGSMLPQGGKDTMSSFSTLYMHCFRPQALTICAPVSALPRTRNPLPPANQPKQGTRCLCSCTGRNCRSALCSSCKKPRLHCCSASWQHAVCMGNSATRCCQHFTLTSLWPSR